MALTDDLINYKIVDNHFSDLPADLVKSGIGNKTGDFKTQRTLESQQQERDKNLFKGDGEELDHIAISKNSGINASYGLVKDNIFEQVEDNHKKNLKDKFLQKFEKEMLEAKNDKTYDVKDFDEKLFKKFESAPSFKSGSSKTFADNLTKNLNQYQQEDFHKKFDEKYKEYNPQYNTLKKDIPTSSQNINQSEEVTLKPNMEDAKSKLLNNRDKTASQETTPKPTIAFNPYQEQLQKQAEKQNAERKEMQEQGQAQKIERGRY